MQNYIQTINLKGVKIIELQANKITIDMIELAINIDVTQFEKNISPILRSFDLNTELKYWDNFKWNRYRHNWIWETEEYTIYLAYRSNSGNGDATNKFKIKYNPNKINVRDRFYMTMLNVFKYAKNFPMITWFDVAFDYEGITTSDIVFDKGRKKEYKIMKYPNSDITYYFGKSGTNGSIKVYDKANEEQKGLATYNKTRLEVTIRDNVQLKDVSTWKCKNDIPSLFIRQIRGLFKDKNLSPTEKILVYAIEQDYPMHELTYRQRTRYREIMETRKELYTKIKPSQLDIEKAIKEYVKTLLS